MIKNDDTTENKISDELMSFSRELALGRYNDEMKWIVELDEKSSKLMGFIGIILGLEIPLLVLLKDIFILHPISTRIILSIIFVIQLILFILSLVNSYYGYKINSYNVPANIKLVNEILDNKYPSKEKAMYQNISDIESSIDKISLVREDKAKSIDKCQKYFVSGCICLSLFILFILIMIICL